MLTQVYTVAQSCFKAVVLVLVVLSLNACSTNPQFGAIASEILSNDTYEVKVTLTVSDQLNPDRDGRPSPLVLYILQLHDDNKFLNADLRSLVDNPQAEVGDDLIQIDQTLTFPDTYKEFTLTVNSETSFLGIVTAYQKEGGKVSELIEIEGRWSRDLCIDLDSTQLTSAQRC